MPREADGDQDATSTDPPQDHSSMHKRGSSSDSRRLIPVPDSPPSSVQLPPSPSLLVQLPPPVPLFEKHRIPYQPPVVDLGQYDHPSYDRIRGQCERLKYSRMDSTAALKTRLAAMAAKESKRTSHARNDMDNSMSVSGTKDRPPVDVVGYSNGSQDSQDKRCRADAPRLASVADKEVARGHTQWWRPELKSRLDAAQSSAVEGVGAAISAWVAEKRNHVLGQELSGEAGTAQRV